MDTLLALLAAKAVIATLLAAVVAVIARRVQRPGVVHALWLLVLLELLSPPLLRVPILPSDHLRTWAGVAGERASSILKSASRMFDSSAFPGSDDRPSAAALAASSEEGARDRSVSRGESHREAAAALGAFRVGIAPYRAGYQSCWTPSESARWGDVVSTSGLTSAGAGLTSGRVDASQATLEHGDDAFPAVALILGDRHVRVWTLGLAWALGAMVVLLLAVRRSRRFRRLVRDALGDAHDLQQRADALASRMGLRRSPTVRVVDGRISPMVWFRRGRIEILFPSELAARLTPTGRDALLAHELAHVRRRDPWVRYVELAASSAFWWHPVSWWARRSLRRAEEHACDARVLRVLPGQGRAYAEAVLETVEFLGGRRIATPSLASGIDEFQNLKERLTMMIEKPSPKLLSRPQQWILAVIAVALVLVLPTWAESAREKDPAKSADVETDSSSMIESEGLPESLRLEDLRALEDQAAALESRLRRVRARQMALTQRLERARVAETEPMPEGGEAERLAERELEAAEEAANTDRMLAAQGLGDVEELEDEAKKLSEQERREMQDAVETLEDEAKRLSEQDFQKMQDAAKELEDEARLLPEQTRRKMQDAAKTLEDEAKKLAQHDVQDMQEAAKKLEVEAKRFAEQHRANERNGYERLVEEMAARERGLARKERSIDAGTAALEDELRLTAQSMEESAARGETDRIAALESKAHELARKLESRHSRSGEASPQAERRALERYERLARAQGARSRARYDRQRDAIQKAIRTLESELRKLEPGRNRETTRAIQRSIEQLRHAIQSQSRALASAARSRAAGARKALAERRRFLEKRRADPDRLRRLRQREERGRSSGEVTPRYE